MRLRPEPSSPKRGLGGIAVNMVSKKEGVLDQEENKLDSLSFQTKRRWRNDGYMPYAEMLVNFTHLRGIKKCVRYTFQAYKMSNGLDESVWRQVQFRRYLHRNKLHLESGRPLQKDLIKDTEKWGNLPQESIFLCLRSPVAAKHQKQQAIIALSQWISLALQIKCGLFVYFFATFKNLP